MTEIRRLYDEVLVTRVEPPKTAPEAARSQSVPRKRYMISKTNFSTDRDSSQASTRLNHTFEQPARGTLSLNDSNGDRRTIGFDVYLPIKNYKTKL